MAHRNARLTVYARRLLVTRVIDQGRPVAFVAAYGLAGLPVACGAGRGAGW
ncbi:leucine zipper domain-containing protein [Plantactinospora sp. ZYX-F-223]|uniref:leucine zipper domain-containing protein n=1 Tax=Plantactinospora sp. ZYX-F-223 TaxID=3144103 RepID=UPI0031FD584C